VSWVSNCCLDLYLSVANINYCVEELAPSKQPDSFHFLLLPSPNILVSEPYSSIMDQGTLLSQFVKSIAHLKESQESQQKALEELTQQMNSLASSYDSLTRSQCRLRENSPDGSVNCKI